MILIVLMGGTTGIACVVGAVTVWANGVDDVHRVRGAGRGDLSDSCSR